MEKNIDDEFLEKEFFGGSSDEESGSDTSNSNPEKFFFENKKSPTQIETEIETLDKNDSIEILSPTKMVLNSELKDSKFFSDDIDLNTTELLENEDMGDIQESLDPSLDSKVPGKDDEISNPNNTKNASSLMVSPDDDTPQSKTIKTKKDTSTSVDAFVHPIDKFSRITILEFPFKQNVTYGPSYINCKSYEIAPYALAMINFETFAVAGTQNSRWLFTGGEDGHIYKWDFFASMNGKTALTQWQKHQQVESVTKAGVLASYFYHTEDVVPSTPDKKVYSPVYTLDTQADGLWVVSGKHSGDIGMWSVRHDEGRCIHNFKRHSAPVSVLKLTYDEFGLISGSWDKNVHYWDLNTAGVARSFKGHISQLSSISFQPIQSQSATNITNQTPLLMTTSIDGQTLLWDVRDKQRAGVKLELPTGTPPWALSSCWSSDGKRIYIGRRNNKIEEFDIVAGKLLQTMKLPLSSGPVSQVCSLPNNNILSASFDNIRLWNMAEMSSKRSIVPFQIIPGHHGATISQMYIDMSGKYLVTSVGSRGWDGSGSHSCLFYEIQPQ